MEAKSAAPKAVLYWIATTPAKRTKHGVSWHHVREWGRKHAPASVLSPVENDLQLIQASHGIDEG